MTERRFVEPPPMSPCIQVCRMQDDGRYCVGCLRTTAEITAWWGMSDAEKRAVWHELRQRVTGSGTG